MCYARILCDQFGVSSLCPELNTSDRNNWPEQPVAGCCTVAADGQSSPLHFARVLWDAKCSPLHSSVVGLSMQASCADSMLGYCSHCKCTTVLILGHAMQGPSPLCDAVDIGRRVKCD